MDSAILTHVALPAWAWSAGSLLALGACSFAASRFLPRFFLTAARVAIALLALRVIFFANPLAWYAYRSVLHDHRNDAPRGIGWRQDATVRFEFESYLERPTKPQLLAAGSSQIDSLFGDWANEHDDFTAFSLPAMNPLGLLLHQDYILEYPIDTLILYLSDLDICARPNFAALPLARTNVSEWPTIWNALREDDVQWNGSIVGPIFAGQLLPEFRYGFVWRGMLDLVSGRDAAGDWSPDDEFEGDFEEEFGIEISEDMSDAEIDAALETLREAGLSEEEIEALIEQLDDEPEDGLEDAEEREGEEASDDVAPPRDVIEAVRSYGDRFMQFNLGILEEFLRRAKARDIPVVIAEGHYHPYFYQEDDRLTVAVREKLVELAAKFPTVSYLPLRSVMLLDADDYEDDVHATNAAGLAFTERLVARLRSQ